MIDLPVLRRFLTGELSAEERERVAAYVEANPSVLDEIGEPANDTLMAALSTVRTNPPDSPAVVAIISAAERLAVERTDAPLDVLATTAPAAAAEADATEEDIAALFAPPDDPAAMGLLGHYRIWRVLGRGGMGVVFEADDTKLDRKVALKVLAPALAARAGAKQRFVREARTMAKVEHDHIIPVYQVGEDRGVPYLAMPLLHGETLDRRLLGGKPLPVDEILLLARQAAEGLAAAHAQGLIHRDIKPSNIWLERTSAGVFKRVRILDFGLARLAVDHDGLTQEGAILGTPAYMAPEQARGAVVDHRADLFSLGCVLYQMATGRRPFAGNDTFAILSSLAADTPAAPFTLNAALPSALSALIVRLLAKDPTGRPQAAQDVVDELARIAKPQAAKTPQGETTEIVGPGAVRRKSHRPLLIAAGVLLFGAVAFGAYNAQTIVRVANNEGELVVEVDDPDVEVVVKGGVAELRTEENGKKRVYLVTAGKDGEVEIREPGSTTALVVEKFQVKRGDKTLVKVTAEKLAAGRKPKEVASVDPDRRAAAWVLSIGGTIVVSESGKERQSRELPAGAFALTGVDVGSNPKVNDGELTAFAGCKNLTELQLHWTKVTDLGLAHFKECKSLKLINLEGCKSITDAGLAHFRNCSKINVLDLRQTGVTDAGLIDFGDCKDLNILKLCWTATTDAGLAQFKNCAALYQLGLEGTKVTDRGLASLKDCPNLDNLHLARTAVSDAGIDALLGFTKLKWLSVRGTKITKGGATKLAASLPECQVEWDTAAIEPKGESSPSPLTAEQRKALEWVLSVGGKLQLDKAGQPIFLKTGEALPGGIFAVVDIDFSGSNAIDDDSIENLRAVPKVVERLHLYATRVSDAGLAKLTAYPGLVAIRDLTLNFTPVTDAGLIHLKKIPDLSNLGLEGTRVTGQGLAHLRGSKLRSLYLRGCGRVGDDAADALVGITTLEQLHLHGTAMTDAGLVKLGAHPSLRSLQVFGPSITDAGVVGIAKIRTLEQLTLEENRIGNDGLVPLKSMPALNNLVVHGCRGFGDAGLIPLKDIPALKTLMLHACPGLTDAGLDHIAQCKTLTFLSVKGCSTTPAGLKKLAASLPQCKIEGDGGAIEPQPIPKLPVGDAPPAKDTFPGKLVFYDTFDDPKASTLFLGKSKNEIDHAVENGAYVVSKKTGTAGNELFQNFGPKAPDLAFAARLRSENAGYQIAFRNRTSATGGNWILVHISPTGRWSVGRNDMEIANGKRSDKGTVLAVAAADDPTLKAGQWVNVAGRAIGSEFEVWINGKRVASGIDDPKFTGPSISTMGLQIAGFVAVTGPARIEVDYIALWDSGAPAAVPPKKP